MNEKECECKSCMGKVFMSVIITAVVVSLGLGGYMVWASKKTDSTTNTTDSAASSNQTVSVDATKGTWQAGTTAYEYTSPEALFTVSIPFGEVLNGDGTNAVTDRDAWTTFVKTAKATQGDKPNIVKITFPTTDKSLVESLNTVTEVGVYTIDEWKAIAKAQKGQKEVWSVVGVDENGYVVAATDYDRGGDWASDWPEGAKSPFMNLRSEDVVRVGN